MGNQEERSQYLTDSPPFSRDSSARKTSLCPTMESARVVQHKEAALPRSKEKKSLIPVPVGIAELVGGDVDGAADLPSRMLRLYEAHRKLLEFKETTRR